MQKVQGEYPETKMVVAENARMEEIMEKILESESDSDASDSDTSGPSDESEDDEKSEFDKLIDLFMDPKTPEKMEIPVEMVELLCPGGRTFGRSSFIQVQPEKKLSEDSLAVERALSIISDYGKITYELFIKRQKLNIGTKNCITTKNK